MATNFTRTNADSMLKDLYPADVLKNLTEAESPLLAKIPKAQWQGRKVIHPIIYGGISGVSNTFVTAKNNAAPVSQEAFEVLLKKLYAVNNIENDLIEVAKTDKGAFANALTLHVDTSLKGAAKVLASQLFRSGGGAIGRVASVSTNASITLTNPDDVINFEVGRVIVSDDTDGGGSVVGTEAITGVDRDNGVLYMASTTGFAVGDYLFLEGSYDAALTGLAAWVPSSAPSATPFFGVDRSVDSRLGGCRITAAQGSGRDLVDRLELAMARLRRDSGRPDTIVVSPENFRKLVAELSAKQVFQVLKPASVVHGFSSVAINGPAGACEVIADPFCPSDVAWVLQMDTWKLYSTTGGSVGILEQDGQLMRISGEDSYELRVGFYGNLACSAPGWNCCVDLSA